MSGGYKENRGIAQGYMPGLISQGLSSSEIIGWLKEEGLTYRTQNMYADINRMRIEQIGAEMIKGFDPDMSIPEKWMRTFNGETSYNYRALVQYSYLPAGESEMQIKWSTLYYNEAPSQNQVLTDWETRMGTIFSGFGSPGAVDAVSGVEGINYYVNKRAS